MVRIDQTSPTQGGAFFGSDGKLYKVFDPEESTSNETIRSSLTERISLLESSLVYHKIAIGFLASLALAGGAFLFNHFHEQYTRLYDTTDSLKTRLIILEEKIEK